MSGALSVSDLSKSYDGREVLRVESLAMEGGAVHALVGPNGSGKSTLLRLLAGLDASESGTVSMGGVEQDCKGLMRHATYVSQDPYLFSRTVGANVSYGLIARGAARAEARERASAALAALGVLNLAPSPSTALSAGERQKVALARAFALEVDWVLLDEPTANIDRESIPLVEERIVSLCRERGSAFVVATHDLAQARRLAAGRTVHLLEGRVVAGSRENLFAATQEGPLAVVAPGVEIVLGVGTRRSGPCTLSVAPERILLSRGPLDSSARNSLGGTVRKLEEREGSVWVTVEAGIPLLACITPQALAELDLHLGERVYATFKASAVHCYERRG